MWLRLQKQFLIVTILIPLFAGCASILGTGQVDSTQGRLFTPKDESSLMNVVLTSSETEKSGVKSSQSLSFKEAIARIEEMEVGFEIEGGMIRMPAMREAAISYGARAGLASATSEISDEIAKNSKQLTQVYNFQDVMLVGPDGTMLQPPVISEARETWQSFEEGKVLRVADTIYEIIEQSRFTSTAPVWQTYLLASFDDPDAPSAPLLPRTPKEKEIWSRWVADGWEQGHDQAKRIFETNLNRLNRDYLGMTRYAFLVQTGRVSPAVTDMGKLGNTGGEDKVRINDRTIRITKNPSLVANP